MEVCLLAAAALVAEVRPLAERPKVQPENISRPHMSKPKLLTHQILEQSAGEWRFEVSCRTPTGRSTWRSQPFASRIEAESELMASLAEAAWVAAAQDIPPSMLPDSLLAKIGLHALRSQEPEAADAAG